MKRREYLTNIGKIKKNGKIKHTFATSFLLPTIGYSEREFTNRLINVHIDKDLEDPMLIIVIDNNQDLSESYLQKLKSNPIFVDCDINETEIAIKFRIPPKYHNIFRCFIKGKYSEFSNEYKQILTNIYGYEVFQSGTLVSIYDAIYPRKDKIRQIMESLNVEKSIKLTEVFDIPNLSYEIYQHVDELKTEELHE